jgi:hypothetical protein
MVSLPTGDRRQERDRISAKCTSPEREFHHHLPPQEQDAAARMILDEAVAGHQPTVYQLVESPRL